MSTTSNEELTVHCSCSHLHHTVRFSWHDDDVEGYVEVSLDYETSWWRRLRVAWRYLWRDTCAYGNVAEIIIKPKDLAKIRDWADARRQKFQEGE